MGLKQRLIHAATTIMLTIGFSLTATAEIKVIPLGGFSYWYGIYSNTEEVAVRESDGTAATSNSAKNGHIEDYWQAKVGVKAESGKISASIFDLHKDYEPDARKLYGNIKYQWTDAFSVELATANVPPGTIGFTATSGLGADLTFGLGIAHGYLAYTANGPGMQLNYKLHQHMNLYFNLYSANPLFHEAMQLVDGSSMLTVLATSKGIVCPTCDLKYLYGRTSTFDVYNPSTMQKTGETAKGVGGNGSGMSVSIKGALSPRLFFGAGYVSGTGNQYDGGPTDSSTAMVVSAMYLINTKMNLAADYGMTERRYFTGHVASNGKKVDGKSSISDFGLKFEMGVGPGSLILSYHYLDRDVESAAADIKESLSRTYTENTLAYKLPLCENKSCGAKFAYVSDTKTPDSSTTDPSTLSFMGASLYASF